MERDATSTTNEKTYPRWLWRIVDEFDRWAADRLPMVQDMILDAVGGQTLPERTLKEALDIARSQGKTATVLWWATGLEERTRRRNPKSEKGKARRKKILAALQENLPSCQKTLSTVWEEHFPGSKETDAPPWRLPDKVAFLARVHDVLIEQDEGRKRRKRWERVAPEFKDVAQEIEFATLFQVESVPLHDGDHCATGSSQIEDCRREVQGEVAAMEGATAGSGTGQQGGATQKHKAKAKPIDKSWAGSCEDSWRNVSCRFADSVPTRVEFYREGETARRATYHPPGSSQGGATMEHCYGLFLEQATKEKRQEVPLDTFMRKAPGDCRDQKVRKAAMERVRRMNTKLCALGLPDGAFEEILGVEGGLPRIRFNCRIRLSSSDLAPVQRARLGEKTTLSNEDGTAMGVYSGPK